MAYRSPVTESVDPRPVARCLVTLPLNDQAPLSELRRLALAKPQGIVTPRDKTRMSKD